MAEVAFPARTQALKSVVCYPVYVVLRSGFVTGNVYPVNPLDPADKTNDPRYRKNALVDPVCPLGNYGFTDAVFFQDFVINTIGLDGFEPVIKGFKQWIGIVDLA